MIDRRLTAAGFAVVLALAGCGNPPEQIDSKNPPVADPGAMPASPLLALVLSSGGPRGFAHIGVLKVLVEAGLRPDIIVGTSSGALVGVLYAANPSPGDLEAQALALGGADVFDYDVFRRRVSGSALQSWVNVAIHDRPLDALTVPVAVVATRQDTGRPVAFTRGDAGAAVRASSAVPGSFAPVDIAGVTYIDGDIGAPLPIAIARAFGAQHVIAVDVAQNVRRAPAPSNAPASWTQEAIDRRVKIERGAGGAAADTYARMRAELGQGGMLRFDVSRGNSMQPDRTALLTRLMRQRILVMDGAMGTQIQQRKLTEADFRGCFHDHAHDLAGDNDLLVLTQPDVVRAIHDEYLAAGADIVETNTFSATGIAQADYGMQGQVYAINHAAARIARECADAWTARTPDKPRFVAGAMGPTNRTASISPDVNDPGARNVTYDELVAAYGEAVAGLAEGGADLILVETIFDTLNAKAALFAIESYFERVGQRLPLIVSGTITDASGRTLSGQTPEAFWNAIRHVRPLAVGLNCALGAALMRPYIEEISRVADTFVSCYPNAGLPNPMSDTGYDETPPQTATLLRDFAASGFVNIVGGCCGTTPAHIRAIADAVASLPPRPLPQEESAEAAA